MFVNLFKQESEDYSRYWISVSTEVYDSKKKKTTGEYIQATMPVRLTSDCKDIFDGECKKSKNKKTYWGRFKITSFLFEAVQPKEDDQYPYVRLVILDMRPAKEDD